MRNRDRSLILCFIGPDGAGKTTIANMLLKSEIANKLFYRKYYFHTNFPILPPLRKVVKFFGILKGKESNNENVIKKDIKPLPWWRAIIYPIYYGINYFLGRFWLWLKKTNGGSIIIFDRYFYEYYINRQFDRCPRVLLSVIEKIIPKPDILIFLKNTPQTIYERKKELLIEEIERQLVECEKIVRKYKNSYIIETTQSPELILDEIKKIIIEKIREI